MPGTGFEERAQARNMAKGCLRQIGTNAIPTLLKMLDKRDSSVVSKLADVWNRHIMGIRHLPRWVKYPAWWLNQAAFLNDEAALGFEILGADAQQAVPALIRLYEEQNRSPNSQAATVRTLNTIRGLKAIGPAAQSRAIPSFLRGAASPNASVREAAVLALSGVDAEQR
jgi:hypothetical protein